MRLLKLKITGRFKNLENFEIDFSNKHGITVLIGNNGSGKSNLLEAISSIFAGLFNNKFNPSFEYELMYKKDNNTIQVIFKNNNSEFIVNDKLENLKDEYLPSQLVSSYSGEENRLWVKYYEPFYQEYIKAIRGSTLPSSKLIYINKYYWNIALLTLHFYDFETFTDIKNFCQKTLAVASLNHVRFEFDKALMKDWSRNANPVTNFVLALNPNQEEFLQLTLSELKTKLSYISNELDFFKYLAAASMPKNDKLIKSIDININNDLSADSLSEGEKKLLLLMLILEVIGDENSLILLDEPDSHIHISRKDEIQKLISKYSNRENILTTHSPTLTHNFDLKHIAMLVKNTNNDVQIETREKQEIVYELTKGIWSYQEQNIFLSSDNDILLIEGKSDETFLKKALEILKAKDAKYSSLQFEYLPCGGADGVKLMTKKFKPKVGQKIIAFFDSDATGWTSINKVFDRVDTNKYSSKDFGKFRKVGDIWIVPYPVRPYYRGGANFNIEDYFSKALLNSYVLGSFKGLDTIVTKDKFKKSLESNCHAFPDREFRHFKVIFDLIIEIKLQNNRP